MSGFAPSRAVLSHRDFRRPRDLQPVPGLAGKCSCECFGSFSVNPWSALVFDLVAVMALLGCRPPAAPEETSTHPLHYYGMGLIALLVCVAGWWQAGQVNVEGTATVEGRPLGEATLLFTGDSGRIVLRTNHDGHFRLSHVLPGLYAVSALGEGNHPAAETQASGSNASEKGHSTIVAEVRWPEVSWRQ